MIAFWGFNHFVIIERVKANKFYIVDPKAGPMIIDIRSFEEMFCDYILVIENKKIYSQILKGVKNIYYLDILIILYLLARLFY